MTAAIMYKHWPTAFMGLVVAVLYVMGWHALIMTMGRAIGYGP